MPKIKIDHIISFSSEDPLHVANNILSNDTSKRWKCQNPGEKNAVVVLQLEKAVVISGIDIGNEHSAYVEILVSRSGTNEDYKVLLVTSSFMTPLESRQSQNANKVRMFTKEHFSKPECEEKWDRVKIVCTQPFNKHVQYGLSFVNIQSNDAKTSLPVQAHIGKFILRPESPDNLSAGSLFEKCKQQKQEEKLTGAAAIREASSSSSLALYGSPVCKPQLKIRNSSPASTSNKESSGDSDKISKHRNRDELLYSKDEEEPNEKIDKIMEKKIREAEEKEVKLETEKTSKNKAKQDESKASTKKHDRQSPKPLDMSIDEPGSSKQKDRSTVDETNRKRKIKDEATKKGESKRKKKEKPTKPFSRLLEGVILVISGIQNPDRSNLRAQALAMGAKYKPDWNDRSTHLICAFPNTPKFNQVKRCRGKIVTRTWIEDCYSQRKRLPWRRYALDKNDATKDESEEEIYEESRPLFSNDKQQDSGSDTDCGEQNHNASDEEIKAINLQARNKKENKNQNDVDIYSADTDEESPPERTFSELTKNLKDIFIDKRFYIDQSFDMEVYNKLLKYIVAYNGKSVDDPTQNIDIIITRKDNSTTLKEVNADALCLGPEWIWDCHNSQKLQPIDGYVC